MNDFDNIYNNYLMETFIDEYNLFYNNINKNNIILENNIYIDKIKSVLVRIKNFFKEIINKIKEFFKNIIKKCKEFISKKFNNFKDKKKLLLIKLKNRSKINEASYEDDEKAYNFDDLKRIENGQVVIMYYDNEDIRVYINKNIKNIKDNFSSFDKLNDLYEKYNNCIKNDYYKIKIKDQIYDEIESNINNIKLSNSEYFYTQQRQIIDVMNNVITMFSPDNYDIYLNNITALKNDISKKLNNIKDNIENTIKLISENLIKFDQLYKDGKCTKEELNEADTILLNKLQRIGPSVHIVSNATKILTDDILKIINTMNNCLIINEAAFNKIASFIK